MRGIIDEVEKNRKALMEVRDKSPHGSERTRAAILLALGRGLGQRGVHRALGHARSAIQKAVRLFREGGVANLVDGRVHKPPVIQGRDQVLDLLPRLLEKQPQEYGWTRSTWSVELVSLQVAQQLGTKVSRTHMGRLLRMSGCRRVRPKPVVALTPKDRQQQMDALRAKLLEIPYGDIVLFCDEVDIHLNPKVGPDWMPPGMRKQLVTPGQNRKWYLAGAYNPQTKGLVAVDGERKNSDLFIKLVIDLARRYSGWGVIHLVLDNYVIHHSKKTLAAVKALNGKVVLHYLPPYSPDDNPIERVWWNLHEHVTRNHRCKTIEDLLAEVMAYLARYSHRGARVAGRGRKQAA